MGIMQLEATGREPLEMTEGTGGEKWEKCLKLAKGS